MPENFYSKLSQTLDLINNRLGKIENSIENMNEKIELSLAIQRNHLIRIKNNQELSDEVILLGRPYNDLTPERAFMIYKNENIDFILIDVSSVEFSKAYKLEDAVSIPLEDLTSRINEIQSKTAPILVISEDGVKSILACEELVRRGYFNINNISGGHKFWPGHKAQQKPASAV